METTEEGGCPSSNDPFRFQIKKNSNKGLGNGRKKNEKEKKIHPKIEQLHGKKQPELPYRHRVHYRGGKTTRSREKILGGGSP